MSEISIRFLIDEDTSHAFRDGLLRRQPSIDICVVGGERAPPLSTKDEEILEYIEREGYILVTSNRKTMQGHLQAHLQVGRHVPGILILRRGYTYGRILETLELIWFAGVPEGFQDRIVHIPF